MILKDPLYWTHRTYGTIYKVFCSFGVLWNQTLHLGFLLWSWGRKSCLNPDIIFQVCMSTVVVPSICLLFLQREETDIYYGCSWDQSQKVLTCVSHSGWLATHCLSAADSPGLCLQRSYDHPTHSVGSAQVEITESPKFLILKRHRLAFFLHTPWHRTTIELSWLYIKVHELWAEDSLGLAG